MLVTNFRLKYILYKIVLAGFQLVDTGNLHPFRERSIRALKRTVDYIEERLPDAVGFEAPKELLTFAVAEARQPGHFLEFGVFTGGTIRYIAKLKRDTIIHGFDSFEGLPESWAGFNLAREAFNLRGRLPRVPNNVVLHRGWFRDTLPGWCDQNPGPISFAHVDCDVYSSTVEILESLRERLQVGTVILFDEYFNYPNWERHEFKAWQDFVSKSGIKYDYLGYSRQQVAVRVSQIGG